MNSLKIKKMSINHFRGITKKLDLNFSNNSDCSSFLLFGENGSGKSSIIDAIEVSTIGKFDRTRKKAVTQSVSYEHSSSESFMTIELSNGLSTNRRIQRRITRYGDEKCEVRGKPIQEFLYAPFVLRRSDILFFWNLNDDEKLKVFWDLEKIRKTTVQIKSETQKKIDKERDQRFKKLKNLAKGYPYITVDRDSTLNDFFKAYNLHNEAKYYTTKNHPSSDMKLIAALRIIEKNITQLNKEKHDKNNLFIPDGKYDPLRERIIRISEQVTASFLAISTSKDYVKKIVIETGTKGELSLFIKVELKDGQIVNPEFYFSEANRDLLALLLYLEFTYDATLYGQAKVLVLDDIFQSVDASIRLDVMIYILNHFADWQLIITTHDRLWKEQIQLLFNNHGIPLMVYQIKRWDFENGPVILESGNMYEDRLQKIITSGTPVEICAGSGYLLEIICEQLSFSLKTSLHRSYGDKYTIGEIWPGIVKACKKTKAKEIFEKLNDLIGLRNLVGCHYNQWAVNLSAKEAIDFANYVLKVYELVYDSKTGKWITDPAQIDLKYDILYPLTDQSSDVSLQN